MRVCRAQSISSPHSTGVLERIARRSVVAAARTNDHRGAIAVQPKLRQRIATSPVARGAAIPLRIKLVAEYDAHIIGRSIDWLVHSRETTNFTYDLDPLNRDHLGW